MKKIFDTIKTIMHKDVFLQENINSYYLIQKDCRIIYPAIGILDFHKEHVCIVSKDDNEFAEKISFNLVFELNNGDIDRFELFNDKLSNCLQHIVFFDPENNFEIIGGTHNIQYNEKNQIQIIIFKIECIVFFKTRFFKSQAQHLR